MQYITVPFSWLLNTLYDVTTNYGVAIILFGLIVKLIMLPFMMKSKLSTMRQSRMTPRIKELEKKYEGNKRKYQEEVAKLYKEENIKPLGGCIWTLIPFPILIALYSVIRQPLTKLMSLSAEQVATVRDTIINMGLFVAPEKTTAYVEITYADILHENFAAVSARLPEVADKLRDIDFSFIGLNLGDTPSWRFFLDCDWSSVSSWLPALGLFLIPIASAVIAFVQTKVSNNAAPVPQQQSGMNMKMMMYMMPLISLWIGFVMPAALGVYWIVNGVFSLLQDMWLNRKYTKILDIEDAERIERDKAKEAEIERKRLETERLRAEGATAVNPNTSRRKRQTAERTKQEERLAAEKAAKRAAEQADKPESQVGERKYARGRAYAADRFSSPRSEGRYGYGYETPETPALTAGGDTADTPPAEETMAAAETDTAAVSAPSAVFEAPVSAAASDEDEDEDVVDSEDEYDDEDQGE